MLADRQTADPLDAVTAVTTPEEICAAQAAVRTVKASDAVLDYILDLADATRSHAQLLFGISTRGALALRHAAQANAACAGRDHILPDDVKAVFHAVCGHRLHAANGLLSEADAAEQLTAELLRNTAVRKL